jgi:predicted DNA-binding ArsR family transcriptional regulator
MWPNDGICSGGVGECPWGVVGMRHLRHVQELLLVVHTSMNEVQRYEYQVYTSMKDGDTSTKYIQDKYKSSNLLYCQKRE